MSDQIAIAAIAAGGSVLTAIVAVVFNTIWIGRNFEAVGKRIDRIEHTLDVVQVDLKQFYRDVVEIKHKIGID